MSSCSGTINILLTVSALKTMRRIILQKSIRKRNGINSSFHSMLLDSKRVQKIITEQYAYLVDRQI